MTNTRRTLVHGALVLIPCAALLCTTVACFGDGNLDRAVAPAEPYPATRLSIGIAPESATLLPGASLRFQLAFQPSGKLVDDPDVQWASADTTVAVIDNSGQVTAMAPGVTAVTATLAGVIASAQVVVLDAAARYTRK
jgi:hypothetical protein